MYSDLVSLLSQIYISQKYCILNNFTGVDNLVTEAVQEITTTLPMPVEETTIISEEMVVPAESIRQPQTSMQNSFITRGQYSSQIFTTQFHTSRSYNVALMKQTMK